MEYASDMIIRAALSGFSVAEVPPCYMPSSPARLPATLANMAQWLAAPPVPASFMPRLGLLVPWIHAYDCGSCIPGGFARWPLEMGGVTLDALTLLFSAAMLIMGTQLVLIDILTKTYASHTGLLPGSTRLTAALEAFSLEVGLAVGLGAIVLGLQEETLRARESSRPRKMRS